MQLLFETESLMGKKGKREKEDTVWNLVTI